MYLSQKTLRAAYFILYSLISRPFERTITLHKDSTGHVGFQFRNGEITALVKESSAARNGLLINHYLLEVINHLFVIILFFIFNVCIHNANSSPHPLLKIKFVFIWRCFYIWKYFKSNLLVGWHFKNLANECMFGNKRSLLH